MAGLMHGPSEEAAVEQMQDSVFYAADILVDGQPPVGDRRDRRRARVGLGEAGEIPRRIDEGVHRVRLAPGWLAANRAGDMLPARMVVEGVAGFVERDVVRQLDWQVGGWHRNN